jgi:GSH-dependent disulfide-bond oxidoreductase
MAQTQSKPIALYYWPTPNGWKISIMLEECGLPYQVHPVNIAQGDQFKPEFLAISPNNRMPAIYPTDERSRVAVDEWLFWQVGGLGPMAGQAHHFRGYAPEQIPYAIDRYTNECNRLYGVMNARLKQSSYLAGDVYSIADMAAVAWATLAERRQGQDLQQFPHLTRWLETVKARPAVVRGLGLKVEEAQKVDMKDPKVWNLLFNQRAR